MKSIEINNVKCMRAKQSIDFTGTDGLPSRWTVIIGANGTGKTTILEAIASVFPLAQATEHEGKLRWFLGSRFTRAAAQETLRSVFEEQSYIAAQFHIGPLDKKSATLESENRRFPSADFDKFFNAANESGDFVSLSVIGGGGDAFSERYSLRGGNKRKDKLEYFSIAAAYGAHRLATSTNEPTILQTSHDSMSSLFSPYVHLINAEEWILRSDYAEKTKKREKASRFEQVKHALKLLMPEIIEIDVTVSKVDSTPRVVFKTDFGFHSLRELSFGYQVTISWIVDLANQMMMHYPGQDDFLSQPALVLVDEIDLHLHPSWQRHLMNSLSIIFPNAQFIVTAHSPLVVQSAPNANIVLLKKVDGTITVDNDPEDVRSWRVDQILTSDLFGLKSARPPNIEVLLLEKKKIMTKSKLTLRDKKRIAEIDNHIGDLPVAEFGDDQEAIDIIRRAAEALRKKN